MNKPAARYSQGANSNDRRILDAATILINPVWNEVDGVFEGLRFGATEGGVSFNPEVTYRTRNYDGSGRSQMKGSQVIESSSVTATAQVAELTDAIIQKTMKADVEDFGDGRKKIVPRQNITFDDYIDEVLITNWLPPTEAKPEGDWMGILMKNVLITSPLVIETEDNGDMVLEVVFTAHNDPADPRAHYTLPYEVITPESMTPSTGEMQVTGGA